MIDVAALYAEHRRVIGGYISKRLNAPAEDIDDIVGDVFLRVVQGAHRYQDRGNASPKPWLFRVTNNLLIDHLRAMKHRTHLPLEPSHDRAVLPALDVVLDRATLLPALDRLTVSQRLVIECRFLRDLSEKQTAEQTGLTFAAVKKLQARALVTLRKYLEVA